MNGTENFARRVAKFLDTPLTERQEKVHPDGEPYVKSVSGPRGNVRGADCYVMFSLYSDDEQSVNDKFVKLLFFIGSLKDAGAARVTVLAPYLPYQRQDRKTESRAPVYTKYSAMLFEASGLDRLITMDVHNLSAFQSSMRILVDNLEAKNLLANYLCGGTGSDGLPVENHISRPLREDQKANGEETDLVVLAPDSGGMERATFFRRALEKRLDLSNKIPVYHLDKSRDKKTGSVSGGVISGDIQDRRVIIYDDLIASGGTIRLCDRVVKEQHGKVWAVCATHLLATSGAEEALEGIDQLVVTDTIPPRLKNTDRLHVVSTVEMFGQAIRRTHFEGGSISELLE